MFCDKILMMDNRHENDELESIRKSILEIKKNNVGTHKQDVKPINKNILTDEVKHYISLMIKKEMEDNIELLILKSIKNQNILKTVIEDIIKNYTDNKEYLEKLMKDTLQQQIRQIIQTGLEEYLYKDD